MKKASSIFMVFFLLYEAAVCGAASSSAGMPTVTGAQRLSVKPILSELKRNPTVAEIASLPASLHKDLLINGVINKGLVTHLGSWKSFVKLRSAHQGVRDVSFAPDELSLATIDSKEACVWDLKTGGRLHAWQRDEVDAYNICARSIHFSPIGDKIAAVWSPSYLREDPAFRTVYMLNPIMGTREVLATTHQSKSIQFSPDGEYLLSISLHGDGVYILDARTGEGIRAFRGHTGTINAARFSLDGAHVVLAGQNGGLYVSDVSTGMVEHTFDGHDGPVSNVRYSVDGSCILSLGRDDRKICAWNAFTRARMNTIPLIQTSECLAMDVSRDNLVACYGQEAGCRKIVLLDAQTRMLESIIDSSADGLNQLAFSPDGSQIALAKENGIIEVWSDYTHLLISLNEEQKMWLYQAALNWLAKKATVVDPADLIFKELQEKSVLAQDERFATLFEVKK